MQHGESEMNLEQKIGGDAPLSARGKIVRNVKQLNVFLIWFKWNFSFALKYSEKLAEYIKKEDIADLVVWTSQFRRTIQTASTIDAPKEQWKALNEIDAVIQYFGQQYLVFY